MLCRKKWEEWRGFSEMETSWKLKDILSITAIILKKNNSFTLYKLSHILFNNMASEKPLSCRPVINVSANQTNNTQRETHRVLTLDIDLAFDRVWLQGSREKLRACGIGVLWAIFVDYLNSRQRRVVLQWANHSIKTYWGYSMGLKREPSQSTATCPIPEIPKIKIRLQQN